MEAETQASSLIMGCINATEMGMYQKHKRVQSEHEWPVSWELTVAFNILNNNNKKQV